jgi:hypothetical protein
VKQVGVLEAREVALTVEQVQDHRVVVVEAEVTGAERDVGTCAPRKPTVL